MFLFIYIYIYNCIFIQVHTYRIFHVRVFFFMHLVRVDISSLLVWIDPYILDIHLKGLVD